MNIGRKRKKTFLEGNSRVLISALLVISIVVQLSALPVEAAEPWEGHLVPQDSGGEAQEEITVDLVVDYDDSILVNGVISYQTDIYFDPAIVNITGATFDDSPFDTNTFSHPGPNFVRVMAHSFGTGAIDPGTHTIASLILNGTAPGVSDLEFSNYLTIEAVTGDIVSDNYTNGTYTCNNPAEPITVDILADGLNGSIFSVTDYSVAPGDITEDGITIDRQSAMGALVDYCQANSIEVEITMGAYGEWLIQIGDDPADMNSWMYAVNETQPTVAASQYTLSDGENIVWFNYNLNYYTVLTELNTTSVEIGDSITATVTWNSPSGMIYLDGAEVYITNTEYVSGTSVGTTSGGTLSFTASDAGRWYVYAEDSIHGSGLYNYPTPYYDCVGNVMVSVVAPDDCVEGVFTVNITVDPLGLQVYAAQYNLSFDPAVIQILDVTSGPLLEEGGEETYIVINEFDNITGTATFAQSRKNTSSGTTTQGKLAQIEFTAIGSAGSSSDIVLSDVVVSDENAVSIPATLIDGSVVICVPNDAPNASARSNHIYNNVGTVHSCEAELDGTQSSDPDGTIVHYNWSFGDGQNGSGEIVSHLYGSYVFSSPSYQPFTATLNVTDDGGLSDETVCDVIVYIAGDSNGDGTVNVLDAAMIGLQWNRVGEVSGIAWPSNEMADRADLNNDRVVDISDAVMVGLCWGSDA